jgi:glutathione S-transferase
MKLYFHPMSSNARRVRIVLRHLAIPVEEELVDLQKGAQRSPAYLALNPNGKVPTLIDGNLKLWESNAIIIYVSEKSGKRELYPEADKVEVHRWLFWGANEFSPIIARFNFENMLKPMLGIGTPDPARLKEHEASFKPVATVLDNQLAQRNYVLGSKLSLADFALAASLMHKERAKLPLGEYANLLAWLSRIEGLPAWQSTAP